MLLFGNFLVYDLWLFIKSSFYICSYLLGLVRDYSFSTYATFSEKLTFPNPWYAQVRLEILKNFAKFKGKHLLRSLFYNKVAYPQPEILLNKRIQHRCFSVNFAKLLKTPFLQNTSMRRLLCDAKVGVEKLGRAMLKVIYDILRILYENGSQHKTLLFRIFPYLVWIRENTGNRNLHNLTFYKCVHWKSSCSGGALFTNICFSKPA